MGKTKIDIEGSMRPLCSSTIKASIIAFLEKTRNSNYHEFELDERQINTQISLGDGSVVDQEICVREIDCTCYSYLPIKYYMDEKNKLFLISALTNVINCLLHYGHFEAELGVGQIRFRTFYRGREKIETEELKWLLDYPAVIIDEYINTFREVINLKEEELVW